MANLDDDESIYEIACECKTLFASHRSNEAPSVIDSLLNDYQHQFLSWAAYMGVFADKAICLDRRLRDRADIRDIVIQLLYVLVEALREIAGDEDNASPMDMDPDESEESMIADDSSEMNDLIQDIETSLARLMRLGATIRKYSATSRMARISKYAEQSDIRAFENLSRMAIDTKYPDAKESLRIQLTRSMVETCASILYKRHHQQKLNTPRHAGKLPDPYGYNESNDNTIPSSENIEPSNITPSLSHLSMEHVPSSKVNRLRQYIVSESAPSVLDSLRTKVLKRYLDPSSQIESNCGASSVQIGRVSYPKPPKSNYSPGYSSCEWCLESHESDLFEDRKQWSAHIDKDFEPYVCLSEVCMDERRLPCYSTFKEWISHMNTVHSIRWQQEIHKPVTWVCNFGHASKYFNTSEELHEHMKECYPESFITKIQVIAKNSYVEHPRSRQLCPLCCRDLVQDKRKISNYGANSRKRRKITDSEDKAQSFDTGEVPENSSGDVQELKSPEIVMARHIASHLQVLMFLTIRFIKCLGEKDNKSSIETGTSDATDTSDVANINSKISWSSIMSQAELNENIDADGLDLSDQPEARLETKPDLPASHPFEQDSDKIDIKIPSATENVNETPNKPRDSNAPPPGKNRGAFRAINLDPDSTIDNFKELLWQHFSISETESINIKKIRLVPSPYNQFAKNAIFIIQGGIPAFLEKALQEKVHIWDKRGICIQIDSDFNGLTQLYQTKGEVLIE
ncbi:hypothetical protein TWF694_004673 [Orbilia ellipsospora]|uniref:Uncharacterized protein n=1 Tax=Orbilia ellipsospora TaxID=2528407 RepID=A0AAV9WX91_9PEZI